MAAQTFVEHPLQCSKCNGELFVECVLTSSGAGFYSFWCARCDQVSSRVELPGDPVGVRIPGVSATRAQVEAAAGQLGMQRYSMWRACGHVKNLLVSVLDSDERYCPRCLSLYAGERLLNEPKGPGARKRIEKCWHDYGGGLSLYLTRHDEGAGPVYRVEDLLGQQLSWHNEAEAKDRALARLRELGHQCSERCRPWEPAD